MKRIIPIIIILSIYTLPGCRLIKNLNKNFDETAILLKKSNSTNLDSLSYNFADNFMNGLIEGLDSDSSKRIIEETIGNIITQFSDSINILLLESRDSLLSSQTDTLIKRRIENISSLLQDKLDNIIDEPLLAKVKSFVGSIMGSITGPETLSRLRSVRDTLLGPEFKALTDSIVRSAVNNAIDEFSISYDDKIKSRLDDIVKDADNVASKTTNKLKGVVWILGFIGLVLVLIAGYFYLKGKKSRDTLKIVTHQVDKIKAQDIYDDLIKGIKEKTTEKGLEKHLQQVLKEQDLYQQQEWIDKNRRMIELIKKGLNDSEDNETRDQLLAKLKKKAEDAGLGNQFNNIVKENPKEK